jgi:hypothetical protein
MIYLHGVAFVNNFVNLPFAFNTTLHKKKGSHAQSEN